ncbi:MAG: hypothetical protein KKD39_07535, partial [Candidatus Altiarchaeota archaeon]|nr:hypothetical protein [Candidatus Altiarchaeota archaeon]
DDILYLVRVMFNLNVDGSFMWDKKYLVYYGIYFFPIFLSIPYFVSKNRNKNLWILAWTLVIFIYSNFGTMSITRYLPIHRLDRHMTIISLPAILVLAYALTDLSYKKETIYRIISGGLIIFLIGTSLIYSNYNTLYYRASIYDIEKAYEILKGKDKFIYCHFDWVLLSYYTNFDTSRIRSIHEANDCEEFRGGYVIVEGNKKEGMNPNPPASMAGKKSLYDCIYNPPKDWVIVDRIKGPDVDYFGRYDTFVYYVPEKQVIEASTDSS